MRFDPMRGGFWKYLRNHDLIWMAVALAFPPTIRPPIHPATDPKNQPLLAMAATRVQPRLAVGHGQTWLCMSGQGRTWSGMADDGESHSWQDVTRPWQTMSTNSCQPRPDMPDHGWTSPANPYAMINYDWPGFAMAGHDGPWPVMAGRGRQWFGSASPGRPTP